MPVILRGSLNDKIIIADKFNNLMIGFNFVAGKSIMNTLKN